jgi:hypothetical protein
MRPPSPKNLLTEVMSMDARLRTDGVAEVLMIRLLEGRGWASGVTLVARIIVH